MSASATRSGSAFTRIFVALAIALPGLGGCELTDEVLAPAEDVVVAEALVQLRDDLDGQRILVFLHRTVSGRRSVEVPGASVVVRGPRGLNVVLPETFLDECVAATPDFDPAGTCYFIEEAEGLGLLPGDRLELSIETAAGEVLRSATTIPGRHEILTASGPWCWVLPDTQLEITWTSSSGAWAYFAEGLVRKLDDALQDEGIDVDTDPFYLTGISVSASDTTIGFPGEFGVFDRADIDTDLALRLQLGVPDGVISDVTITALDRNYTNWVRGGNFNPSGQVRIPSVRGEGTGYFGSTVVRAVQVLSIDLGQPSTRCGGPPP